MSDTSNQKTCDREGVASAPLLHCNLSLVPLLHLFYFDCLSAIQLTIPTHKHTLTKTDKRTFQWRQLDMMTNICVYQRSCIVSADVGLFLLYSVVYTACSCQKVMSDSFRWCRPFSVPGDSGGLSRKRSSPSFSFSINLSWCHLQEPNNSKRMAKSPQSTVGFRRLAVISIEK